jgi:hypothetical protein
LNLGLSVSWFCVGCLFDSRLGDSGVWWVCVKKKSEGIWSGLDHSFFFGVFFAESLGFWDGYFEYAVLVFGFHGFLGYLLAL